MTSMQYKLRALPILETSQLQIQLPADGVDENDCDAFDICIDVDVGVDVSGSTGSADSASSPRPSTRKFCELLDAHKALVLSRSHQHQHLTVDDFGNLVVGLQLTYYPYIGGAAPRTVIPITASTLPVVFTANESPPDQPIRTFICADGNRL